MRTKHYFWLRPRPQARSGCFRIQPTLKLRSVWHQKRKFPKTFPRAKIFENATLSFICTCGRTNTEVFQPRSQGPLVFQIRRLREDPDTCHTSLSILILLALRNIWKGCNHTSTASAFSSQEGRRRLKHAMCRRALF